MSENNEMQGIKMSQRGISLTEALLGVATLGVGLGLIADMQVENLRKVKAETAAQQMQIVFTAAQAAVRDYYTDIISGCGGPAFPDDCSSVVIAATPDGTTRILPPELLIENNYLDPALVVGNEIRQNNYGQDYVISVRNIGPPPGGGGDRLRVQVVTQGGTQIDEVSGAQIAAAVGSEGGFRPPDGGSSIYVDDTMYGAYGAWQMTQAEMGGAGAAPSDGGLAAVAYFGEGGIVGDFLYRNPVPGQPEAQQMNANIDLNEFGLGNVRQIGGSDGIDGGAGTVPTGNPDLVTTSNRAAPITGTFGPGATVDTFAGADPTDTVRFGNPLAGRDIGGVASDAYARGNVNIQANNAVLGAVDAEYRVRAQERLEAVSRNNLGGQRAVVDSGLGDDGAANVIDLATAAAGARSTDTGFKFYDAGNAERGIFTYEAATDGRLSMGTNTTAPDSRRIDLTYGRNAADGLAEIQGGITTRDDGGSIRSRQAYGATNDGTEVATAGEFRLNDAAQNRVRLDYGNNLAGATAPDAGNLALLDTAQERVRMDYGLDSGGGALNSAGKLAMRDDGGVRRVRADYGLLQGGGATANAGNLALADTGSNERFRADYGQDAAGAAAATAGRMELRDAGGSNRVAAYYGLDAAGNAAVGGGVLSMRDNGDLVRYRSTFNGGQGDVISRDNGDALRYEQEYVDNNTGRVAIRDRANQGADEERFIAAYTNTDGNLTLRDAGSQNRFRAEFAGLVGNTSSADSAGRLRFEQNYTNGTSTEIVRSQTNTIRRQFDTAGNLFDLRGPNGVERVRIDSSNGNFVFANSNSADAATSGGYLNMNTSDGGLEIGSGNDPQSFIDFKGSGNLTADFRGRVLYDDATDSMRIATAGAAGGEVGIQNGSLVIAGDGAEGGQLILSSNNALPTGETPTTWSMDAVGSNLRIFRGDTGASNIAMIASDVGRVGIGSNNYFGGTTPTARLDIYCTNAADPTDCLRVRNEAGARSLVVNPNANGGAGIMRIGAGGPIAAAPPLGANQSVMDVDDIYLRSRGIWLSETNLPNSLTVVGIDVVSMGAGGSAGVSGTLAGNCPGTIYYVAMPAWWLSPTMMTAVELTTTAGGLVLSSSSRNPQSGAVLGSSSTDSYDNNTEVRVYMSGATVNMQSRQRNHTAWRAIEGGVAVVTGYCDA